MQKRGSPIVEVEISPAETEFLDYLITEEEKIKPKVEEEIISIEEIFIWSFDLDSWNWTVIPSKEGEPE